MFTTWKLLLFITGNRSKNKPRKQTQKEPCGFQVYFLKCVNVLRNFIPVKGHVA